MDILEESGFVMAKFVGTHMDRCAKLLPC